MKRLDFFAQALNSTRLEEKKGTTLSAAIVTSPARFESPGQFQTAAVALTCGPYARPTSERSSFCQFRKLFAKIRRKRHTPFPVVPYCSWRVLVCHRQRKNDTQRRVPENHETHTRTPYCGGTTKKRQLKHREVHTGKVCTSDSTRAVAQLSRNLWGLRNERF